jgi:hypothetical protein
MKLNMNSSDITIEDVNLQIEKSSGHIEGKVQVCITLKNNSKTSTYYVLKRPRTLNYDRGSHTFSIGLYEKELPEGVQVCSSPFEPEQVAILPDTTFDWQYLVPVWMKKIIRPAGLREIVEVVDISAVRKVVCTLACHTSPFRVTPSDTPEEVRVALCKWGETVSESFERKLIEIIY